jgi:hypothetical protein
MQLKIRQINNEIVSYEEGVSLELLAKISSSSLGGIQ